MLIRSGEGGGGEEAGTMTSEANAIPDDLEQLRRRFEEADTPLEIPLECASRKVKTRTVLAATIIGDV